MPKANQDSMRSSSRETRDRIFNIAMNNFRQHGFEQSTIRDIAKQAEISVGLAYHYFPSKEAIVGEYYLRILSAHQNAVQLGLTKTTTFAERIRMTYKALINLVEDDQKVLGVIMKFIGEPDHPLSILGEGTRPLQKQVVDIYLTAIEKTVPADSMDIIKPMLWSLHMGLLLYFIYDTSENHKQTYALIDGSVEILNQFVTINSNPLAQPFIAPTKKKISKLLAEAGLSL